MATYNYGHNPIGAFSDNAAMPNNTNADSTALNIGNLSGQVDIVIYSDNAWTVDDDLTFKAKVLVSTDGETYVNAFATQIEMIVCEKVVTEPLTTTAGQQIGKIGIPKEVIEAYDYIKLNYTTTDNLALFKATALLVGNA